MSEPEKNFDSSDADRHACPLKHAQYVTFKQPFQLKHGGVLEEITVCFETYGRLNERRDNAVLICHALSGDSHVAQHDEEDDPGWWDLVVGPGKSIDTNRYFVICPNVLGGCRGSTGPESVNPATGRPYGADFPLIVIEDIVDVQRMLVDHLQIERLLAVIGGSLGGFMTLTWAVRHPDRIDGAIVVASSAHLTSQALAFDIVGRNAILRDPDYQGGQYYGQQHGPDVGLAIARMLGHITYLSRESMTQKFDHDRLKPRDVPSAFETRFSVGSYLAYQGDRFVERFDANSYVMLTMAMDMFELGSTSEALAATLRLARCRWLLISYTSDWLFPSFQSQEIVHTLTEQNQPVSYCNIQSDGGHDSFLLEQELYSYGRLIEAFLANLAAATDVLPSQWPRDAKDPQGSGQHAPTSIFHDLKRIDYNTILELIPPDASVLDLGCGSGGLLERLQQRGHKHLVGVELDQASVIESVSRNVDVIQADLNQGLSSFLDRQFDYVVLSKTLQTVIDVERIVEEMLRVGGRVIVSFPNLGFGPLRSELAHEGRAPRGDATQGFQWYNTPNVRFLTITDFETFCREKQIQIERCVALDTQTGRQVSEDPNLFADMAIVVLSR